MPGLATELHFDVQRGPECLVIMVENLDCDSMGAVPLAQELLALLDRHSIYRFILRMDDVPMLTSHLVGELVRLQRMVSEHGGMMRLAGLSSQNCRVLHECRLEDRFQAYATWEDALRGCAMPRAPR